MRARIASSTALLLACAVLATACGSSAGSSSSSKAATSTSASASSTAAAACPPGKLKTLVAGRLTVATDKPAYPPYFENDNPSNGKGFESAVAYAVASRLGYAPAQVKWVVEPFDSSYAPGPKNFDFDINEISITPVRAKAVDFSVPYYQAPQAVVANDGSKAAHATSLAALRSAQLGVQIGTTSLAAVQRFIKPTVQPKVFNTSDDVVAALKVHEVDAIVTDLPTAYYMTAVQVPHATIVGQFSAPGGDTWGLLLSKGSSLTRCVDMALDQLRADGKLAQITAQWMGGKSAPELH